MEKNKRVINNRYERAVRTLSYALLLISSFIIGVNTIVNINWQFIQTIFNPINNFLTNELDFMSNYLLFTFFLGIVGLVWTQSRNYFLRIFTTILLVVVSLINDNVTATKVFDFIPRMSFINDWLDQLLMSNNWLLLVIQITPLLFVYILFNARKPKRLGLSVLLSGVGFLMLKLVLNELPTIINNDWLLRDGYRLLLNINLVTSLSFIAVGSALGIVGFFRK